jgi:hypothetical protein
MTDRSQPAIFVQAEVPLTELARQINDAHRQCEQALKSGLSHALAAGQLLLEVKSRVGHGGWLGWLKANFGFSERTAQTYMRVARRWPELEAKAQRVADLSYRDAVALLSATAADAEVPAEDAVPPALAYYREAGLLNDDALSQVLDLAGDYGPDLTTPFNFTAVPPISSPDDAWWQFNMGRPLDHPTLWPLPRMDGGVAVDHVVTEAAKRFEQDARARHGSLPHWEVTAFWFASQMIRLAARVPKVATQFTSVLAHHLKVWRESFRTALAWMLCYGTTEDGVVSPSQAEERAIWWGYHSDLRHSGALEAAGVVYRGLNAYLGIKNSLWEGLGMIGREGSYLLPSSWQRGVGREQDEGADAPESDG